MTDTFWEKYKDPRWQKKRLEVFERDEWTCLSCEEKSETLHVHHGYYAKGKDPWEYDLKHLFTLCEGCHEHHGAELHDLRMLIGSFHPCLYGLLFRAIYSVLLLAGADYQAHHEAKHEPF